MKLACASILGLATLSAGCSAIDSDWHELYSELPLLTLQEAREQRNQLVDDVDAPYWDWAPATYVLDYPKPKKASYQKPHRQARQQNSSTPVEPPVDNAATDMRDTVNASPTPNETSRQAALESPSLKRVVPTPSHNPPSQPTPTTPPAAAMQQAMPAPVTSAEIDAVPDCSPADEVCRQKLAALLADKTNVWVFAVPKPADYMSGVRLYAYHKRRNDLNCTELGFGLKETAVTSQHLAAASDSNDISLTSKLMLERVQGFATKIGSDLAEIEKRKCVDVKQR